MNAAAILALISDLYAQVAQAQERAARAEARVADLEAQQQPSAAPRAQERAN